MSGYDTFRTYSFSMLVTMSHGPVKSFLNAGDICRGDVYKYTTLVNMFVIIS